MAQTNSLPTALPEEPARTSAAGSPGVAPLAVERLSAGAEREVLAFLSVRPEQTFGMVNKVRDNGLESPNNRGDFYACRESDGRLAGVALLGHATLFEARRDEAVVAFARAARTLAAPPHIIFGEREPVRLFWEYYGAGAAAPRTVRALLLEQRYPVEVPPPVPELRAAVAEDARQVAEAHAEMAFAESGVNPLVVDPEGFMRRTLERIGKGRVWVCACEGRMSFKADIVSETPDVIYLEGVYVHPEQRGKGFGYRCFAKLVGELLRRTRSVVIVVNADNTAARALYERAGFRLKSHYELIYPAALV
jgi:hypothetical protein